MVNRQECADGEYVYQIITKDVFDNIKFLVVRSLQLRTKKNVVYKLQ